MPEKRADSPASSARYVGCRNCDERDSFAHALVKHLQRLNSNTLEEETIFRKQSGEQQTCRAAIADEPFLRRTN
jgi:hypothetical protein